MSNYHEPRTVRSSGVIKVNKNDKNQFMWNFHFTEREKMYF